MKPTFQGTARRPAPEVKDALLQWATGLPTNDRRIYTGWFVERGKLEDLDAAMKAAGFSQVTIKHGSGNLVTHWAVETANVFLIAEGVQTIAEMKHTAERYGIAFGWKTLDGGRQQSQLKARVILAELYAVGYTDPLLLTVKSTLTGDVLTAFLRQYDVLDAAGGGLPLYALSLPLGPGAEVARGSGGQTKEITPPIALIPTPITEQYISERWIPQAACNQIEAMIADTCRWSIEASAMIGAEDTQPANASYEQPQDAPQQSYRADTRTQLGSAPAGPENITEGQRKALWAIWKEAGWDGTVNEWIHNSYQVASMNDLTKAEASQAIETLKSYAEKAA